MDGDLFSAGFAWGADPVAAPATADATPMRSGGAGVPSISKGPVAAAATPCATVDMGIAISEKVTENHLFGAGVATVATVAETEGQRLERLLSQKSGVLLATPVATAQTADFCGVEGAARAPVAAVASVANWMEGVEALRRARPHPKPYHTRWRTVLQDASSFVKLWGDDAIRMGWSTLDVFGVNADPAHARYDRLGLVILLAGRPIQCLEADVAHIGKDAKPTVYRRSLRAGGAVPIWQWVEGRPQ